MADTNTLDVIDSTGKKVGSVDLPAETFDRSDQCSIHQVVVAQRCGLLARARTTRSAVAKCPVPYKPFKQKRNPHRINHSRLP
jgi:large subunit ribosomal protein L4